MLAAALAAGALTFAAMGMVVGMGMIVQMVVVMGVYMVMLMDVGMRMGMGNTVMGVLVGVFMGMRMLVLRSTAGNVIFVDVHCNSSFVFFLLYSFAPVLSKYLFSGKYPRWGLPKGENPGIITKKIVRKQVVFMSDHHEHAHMDHEYLHAHGIAHSHNHVHENQKAVINRLSRAIGHLEKVKRMVEEGHDCSEVLIQLAAVRSALDNTGKVILKDHMRHCMVDAVAAGDQDAIDDLCQAIDKFMK